MTFKEQLEATVQEGRDYNAITAEVKEILLAAAKSGESNVFLPLTDEHGYKVGAICHFLENENIKFKKIYDSRQVEKPHYLDPHYQETVVRNGGKTVYTWMDTEYTFKGIRVLFDVRYAQTMTVLQIDSLLYLESLIGHAHVTEAMLNQIVEADCISYINRYESVNRIVDTRSLFL